MGRGDGGAGRLAATTVAVLVGYLALLLGALARLAATGPGGGGGTPLPALLAVSLGAALLATAAALVLGVPAALWLARARPGVRRALSTVLDVPTMLSPVAVGTAVLLLLREPPGAWADRALGIVFGFPGVVLAQFTVVVALVVRAAEAAFARVDPGLERLAALHGASRARVLRDVTLPMAAPGLLAAAVLAFARALGEFGATVTVAGTVPGRTETLASGIFLAIESGDLARAATLSLALVAVAAVALVAMRLVAGRRA